jgi:hypothetical protein
MANCYSIKESILKIGAEKNVHPRVPISVELKFVHAELIISEVVPLDAFVLTVSSIVVRLPVRFYSIIQNNHATMNERDESRNHSVSRQCSFFRFSIPRLQFPLIRQE